MKRKKKNVQNTQVETAKEEKNTVWNKIAKFIKKWWIVCTAVVLAVVVAVVGIVIIVASNDEYTTEDVNPYAVMKLSNGMTINYEIFEDECPVAATNFIYLANIGYFDGTVLFDSQGGWVRFGGWQADGVHRGDANKSFTDKITLSAPTGKTSAYYANNKFGYRLKQDTAKDYLRKNKDGIATIGALCFAYERSATEFQIVASENPMATIENGGEWKVAPFALASDDQSLNNIKALANLTRDDGTRFNHNYYRAPLDGNGLITIKSIRVRQKNETKWKSFDFVSWFKNDASSSSRLKSWTTYQKKTGDQ
ncbi:MAG: peptidylprolyl isomerase [Clostridia bacterium]|nr:peptidylprolyl isomerase [Clostridia bacterium]